MDLLILDSQLLSGLIPPSSLTSANSLPSPTAVDQQQLNADQVELSGYGQLLGALSSFSAALQSLEPPTAIPVYGSTSTNPTTATASTDATAVAGQYPVGVQQVAQAQVVESGAVSDPDSAVLGSGTLSIQLGTYAAGPNTFTAANSGPVPITISNGSLNSIAASVNSANAGVAASVIQDSAGYHLVLTSTNLGAANGFRLTVQDGDGTNTDTSGLSQLAYDPTAAAGAGKNLSLTQPALNATVTVNGVAISSASNTGISLAQGVTLTALQTGTTTVTVSPSEANTATAAQQLVTAYNSLVQTIQQVTPSGSALAQDPLVSTLQSDLQHTAGSLASLGITLQTDGSLAVNASTLQNAFTADPGGTARALSQAAQSLDTLTQNYGAGGTLDVAAQGLQQQVGYLQLKVSGDGNLSGTSSSSSQEAWLTVFLGQMDAALLTPLSGSGGPVL
jgi:flagellar hook-associated protein 2